MTRADGRVFDWPRIDGGAGESAEESPEDGVFVYLGLGANLGARQASIEKALSLLGEQENTRVVRASRLRETEPVGGPPQGPYLNGVAEIRTTLSPQDLLDLCLSIEDQLGRQRTVRNGPRPIDLDVLFYGDAHIQEDNLEVPHPRMLERAFVLEPLAELAPDRLHPLTGKSAGEHWEALRAEAP